MKRPIPKPLWVALVALGIVTPLTLLSIPENGLLVPLIASACNLALLVGLTMGHKWAYVLTLLFSMAGVIIALGNSVSQALFMMIGNVFVFIPVILSIGFFFPVQGQRVSQ